MDELAALAEILCKCSRYKDAIECMNKIIAIDPVLSPEHSELFKTLYKTAVDVRRDTLRMLNDYLAPCTSAELADKINSLRDQEFTALKLVCDECIEILNEKLIPNAKDSSALVFFKKMKGDFSRYICEYADGELLEREMESAEKSYQEALELAEKDLNPTSSVRLGAMLNYAVFKYEQCEETDTAKRMLTQAIESAGNDFAKLSEGSRVQTLDIIQIMKANLDNWNKDESNQE